jgi:parallel beta-helix repeat protein
MKANFFSGIRALALISIFSAQLSTARAQGSLTPPGAPGPTMKSLAQIEPRTPISSLPLIITAPGSYYLTTNLSANSGSLSISTSSVTIELNGFTISGNGIYTGISCGSVSNICIKDGNLVACANGVDGSVASAITIENVHASSNSDYGLILGPNSSAARCTSVSNKLAGISLSVNCRAADCVASLNGGNGISTQDNCILTGCAASANQSDNITTSGANCVLVQCTAQQSANGSGFNLGVGNNVVDCAANGNSQDGILLSDRSTVQNCIANFNARAGIHCGFISTVQDCTCLNNGTYGVLCDSAGYAYILNNNCTFNGLLAFFGTPTNGAGIFITNVTACRIEGNMLNFNYYGLVVTNSTRCFMVRNSAESSVISAYVFGAGNSYGPIVNVIGVGDISATANANHPQANFIH